MARPGFVALSSQPTADPLYERLYRDLRERIASGRLAPGVRLPASRALAAELGLARNTVLRAYAELVAEGHAEGRTGAGTFVRARPLPEPAAAPRRPSAPAAAAPELSAFGRRMLQPELAFPYAALARRMPLAYDFLYGVPDVRLFPREVFRRLFARRLRHGKDRALAYGMPQGDAGLVESVRRLLAAHRGVVAEPEQIVIVNGTHQGLDLVTRLLVDASDRVVLEDPSYPGFAVAAGAHGALLVPVPVDAHGIEVARLPELPCRLAYVTPSHQFPTGAVLSPARRRALLAWAGRAGAFVFEDDYDGEFRFGGPPIDALHALDREARVIYAATFSKSLAPSLRLGALVLPPALAALGHDAKWLSDWSAPTLTCQVLSDFIDEGHYERHLARMRAEYAARRAALVHGVTQALGTNARIGGADAGLHLSLWLDDLAAHELDALVAEAARDGVGVYSIARYAHGPVRRPGLLLGYGLLRVAQIGEGVRRLGRAFETVMARRAHTASPACPLPAPPPRARAPRARARR